MSNIIDFRQRKVEAEPHAQGDATCIGCKHKWHAVAHAEQLKENDGWLECPACGTNKGRMAWPFVPSIGSKVWTCHCGSDIFYVLSDGTLCPNCGNMQDFP